MDSAGLEQVPSELSIYPLVIGVDRGLQGPSGGARTNKVAGSAHNGSGSSSFPKGTKILSIFLRAGAALPVCVGWISALLKNKAWDIPWVRTKVISSIGLLGLCGLQAN